jgi:hypothetical protein
LRTKWVGVHTNEVFFRDTAHGFLAWAFATLLSATVLSSAAAYLANGIAAGLGSATSQVTRSANSADLYIDKLFRTNPAGQLASAPTSSPDTGNANPSAPNTANPNQTRAEVLRLWTSDNQDLSAADKTYVTQVVAARTGLMPRSA